MEHTGTDNMLCVPVVADARQSGAVIMLANRASGFTKSGLTVFELYAKQVGVALGSCMQMAAARQKQRLMALCARCVAGFSRLKDNKTIGDHMKEMAKDLQGITTATYSAVYLYSPETGALRIMGSVGQRLKNLDVLGPTHPATMAALKLETYHQSDLNEMNPKSFAEESNPQPLARNSPVTPALIVGKCCGASIHDSENGNEETEIHLAKESWLCAWRRICRSTDGSDTAGGGGTPGGTSEPDRCGVGFESWSWICQAFLDSGVGCNAALSESCHGSC